MVWGKPHDVSRHSEGAGHICLRILPCLTLMVNRVKATLEGIFGKSLCVMTQGYIESISPVRELPHRDFPVASLPADGLALSVFWAVSMDFEDDDTCAQFVAMFACALPRPWVVRCMPMKRGSVWVIFSTVMHEAGDLPLSAELGLHCITRGRRRRRPGQHPPPTTPPSQPPPSPPTTSGPRWGSPSWTNPQQRPGPRGGEVEVRGVGLVVAVLGVDWIIVCLAGCATMISSPLPQPWGHATGTGLVGRWGKRSYAIEPSVQAH